MPNESTGMHEDDADNTYLRIGMDDFIKLMEAATGERMSDAIDQSPLGSKCKNYHFGELTVTINYYWKTPEIVDFSI